MVFLFSVLMLFIFPMEASASCSFAEQAEKSGKMMIAYMQYIYCSEEENDAEAQYKLGEMYYKGIGLSRPDYKRAVAFFYRSAKNGYAPAQVKLGLLYWRGEGIEKNLKMAHMWLYLAQEPANMRWFYFVGPSQDPNAASLYAKISSAIKAQNKKEKEKAKDVPMEQKFLDSLKGSIPSYKEVAEFQHKNLIEAGQELLDEHSQAALQGYLNSLKPDINPALPAGMPEAQQYAIRQMIVNWFKPVLLTEKNFVPSKIPVLKMLKNEIEKPVGKKLEEQ